jgi:hypothetical protein
MAEQFEPATNFGSWGYNTSSAGSKRNNVPTGAGLSGGVCMTKKIFALVMVVSVLGAFLAGCKKDEGGDAAASGGASAAASTDAKS